MNETQRRENGEEGRNLLTKKSLLSVRPFALLFTRNPTLVFFHPLFKFSLMPSPT